MFVWPMSSPKMTRMFGRDAGAWAYEESNDAEQSTDRNDSGCNQPGESATW